MTNREALALLENATAVVNADRATHKRIEDAITILAVLVDKDEKAAEKKAE